MNEWERRPDESKAAFDAFKEFLGSRSLQRVSTELSKSRQLISRWARRYDWYERARAWDNSIVEGVRNDLRRDMARQIRRQYEQVLTLQDKSFANMKRLLDSSPRSLKTLTELYFAARTAQWELYDKIVPAESAEDIKIIIEDATPNDKEN